MLARYAYSNCSNFPTRSATAEFLLKNGTCERWVTGNNIVTITTSGSLVGPSGLCKKCLHLAGKLAEKKRQENQRKRHQSAACETSQSDKCVVRQKSFDDSGIGRKDGLENSSASEDGVNPKIDEIMLGLGKNKPDDASIFTQYECSCWVNAWVEVHIRRPTGNVSWLMRSQNDTGINQVSIKQCLITSLKFNKKKGSTWISTLEHAFVNARRKIERIQINFETEENR